MRYLIIILALAGLAYVTGQQFNKLEQIIYGLQADVAILNAYIDRLDERITQPYKPTKPIQRTEFFI